jgi:hypothetical protein
MPAPELLFSEAALEFGGRRRGVLLVRLVPPPQAWEIKGPGRKGIRGIC